MVRKTKKHQKKLAKLVLAALLFSGGAYGLMGPSVAEAADPVTVTVTGYTEGDGFAPDPRAMEMYDSYYYAPSNGNVTVLNLENGSTWSDPGIVAGHVGSDANGITVNMTGTNVVVGYLYGGFAEGSAADAGSASENSVNISAGQVEYNVTGGYSYYGDTLNNTVTINGDAAVGYDYSYAQVYGGEAENGSADSNTITINGKAAVGSTSYYIDIYGGVSYSSSADEGANNNTVTISGNAAVGSSNVAYYQHIFGGEADYGSANNNTVTINGNSSVDSIYYMYVQGGDSSYGSANNNTVTISDKATVGSTTYYMEIYGGDADYGSANNNTITISGSAVVGSTGYYVEIIGGDADYGSANNNTVTISDSASVGANVDSYVSIYGGNSYYGDTLNNTVTISDNAAVGANVDGYVSILGGLSYYGSADNNTVTISGGTVGNVNSDDVEYSNIIGGYVYSPYGSDTEASGNTVTIEGDTTSVYVGAVVGGYSPYAENAVANTNNNTVTIDASGAEVGLVYGGRTYKGNANENTVTLTAGSVTGKADSPSYYYGIAAVAGGYSVDGGDAKSNTVEISGVTVNALEDVMGIPIAVVGGYAGGGDATGNTVKLQDATISGGGVYGGITESEDGDDLTGNTLVISGSSTVDGEVSNFETIKLAKTLEWNTEAPVLKAKLFDKKMDGTARAALDVSDVKTDIAPGKGGQMTLLASERENNFAILDLIYSDGTATLDESKQSQVVKDEEISEERKGVAVISQSVHTVSLDEENSYKNVLYSVENETKGVSIKEIKWQKDAELFDGSGYDYQKVTKIDTSAFDVTYEDDVPQTVAKGDSMTLLKANETLKAIVNEEKSKAYSFTPVSGVTVDAAVTGKLANSGNNVVFTATENKAGKLTFGDVEWKTSGALLKRPSNIIFAGADVDTAKINFVNVTYLDANQKMTLVSDFGDSVGTITGSKYMAGTAFEGEGKASLKGGDLIFTTTTEAGLSEQTHKTVMAMDAGLAMLKTGSEFVGKTIDGLADIENKGKDGVSTFASVGGGTSRYSTGSHVNTHAWNAVVGVGKTNETKKGTIEYGVFGEYGKGSYTLHNDAGNGDGDAHYAGGGLLAKFTNKHNVYAEGSIRAGRLSDSSSDIMRDGLGNAYGYDVHANYYGAHIGAGKIINYKGGKSLDVYGKFFYLKRDGVEYDAVQHYNLDSVSSSILRLGARYGTTDKKWNWYGGLAYEYEFDGEATGTVNGKEIRAASIKGSSVRGEFGMRMDATKDNPWQTDISIYGYGGKHRGFGGNVSVTYKF